MWRDDKARLINEIVFEGRKKIDDLKKIRKKVASKIFMPKIMKNMSFWDLKINI